MSAGVSYLYTDFRDFLPDCSSSLATSRVCVTKSHKCVPDANTARFCSLVEGLWWHWSCFNIEKTEAPPAPDAAFRMGFGTHLAQPLTEHQGQAQPTLLGCVGSMVGAFVCHSGCVFGFVWAALCSSLVRAFGCSRGRILVVVLGAFVSSHEAHLGIRRVRF